MTRRILTSSIFALVLVLSFLAPVVGQEVRYGPPAQSLRDFSTFGGLCDGASDDFAAFTAAIAWMKTAPNRLVTLPAGAACVSSQSVQYGDGRQLSTTLGAGASGSTITVASITGIQNGDDVTVVRNDNSLYRGTVNGVPSGVSVPITPAYSGTTASSGNLVYTGKASSYNGGGFIGFGAATTLNGTGQLSSIKASASFPLSPTTTLTAQANPFGTANPTLTVASNAGISLGTPLMAVLDNGDTFWTTVVRTPTSTTIFIANDIPTGRTIPNAGTITIVNNPVVQIAGPINAPVFDGIDVDANGRAGIGLDVLSVTNGKLHGAPGGVSARNYTGTGGFFRSHHALIGGLGSSADSDITFSAFSPANGRTIGAWTYGPAARNQAYSRNRFHGGTLTMGGNDSAAAALREEHADNQTFEKMYTTTSAFGSAGAGVYRQCSINSAGLGGENVFIGPALKGGVVVVNNCLGGSLGNNLYSGYGLGDGEPLPNTNVDYGSDANGHWFVNRIRVGASNTNIKIYGDAVGTYIWGIGRGGPSTNGLRIESLADIALYYGASSGAATGTLGFLMDGSGNVGIGPATTLGAKLDVQGTGRFSGAITPTGGVAASATFSASPRLVGTCGVGHVDAAVYSSQTPVTTEFYFAEVFIPANVSVTGVAVFNSATISGNMKVGLFDSAGNLLKTSASTAMSGTSTYQRVAFTGGAYSATGPATYYIGVFYDNATVRPNTFTTGNCGVGKSTGQTYATGFTTIAAPTTFTTALAPVAGLY